MEWTNHSHVITYHAFYAHLTDVNIPPVDAHAQAVHMTEVWLAEFVPPPDEM